jgi:CBS domain-containing protein
MEKKVTVKDPMTTNVRSCRADADLASVAKITWDCDCGTLPVVNEERKVTGMITARDICIAAATRSTAPANIRVRDVTSGHVHTCFSEDDVSIVLRTMKEWRVRRLPVLDRQGRLVGIVSLNDLVARADRRSGANVPGDEFLATLKSICEHSATAVPA